MTTTTHHRNDHPADTGTTTNPVPSTWRRGGPIKLANDKQRLAEARATNANVDDEEGVKIRTSGTGRRPPGST